MHAYIEDNITSVNWEHRLIGTKYRDLNHRLYTRFNHKRLLKKLHYLFVFPFRGVEMS